MAVTAKFLADFASFHDAVEKADVELKGMEANANKVSSSLSKMTDSLSGRKLVQDATLAVEAVDRIGGTSKLTAAELTKVQTQASAAAEKLRAMGQDVPPGIQRIADSVRNTGNSLESMKGLLGSVAGAFGLAFSVGAVVNFGKHVFDTASNIHDLAEKLGISTDAVQGFKFAAEQSGSSLDAVGIALNKMNANLAGGDKATVQALKDAGLQFSAIRNLKPEDAFLAIADAIQSMTDPMKQADVQLALFGKGGAELLPGMKEGFRQLSQSAVKMSEDTVNSLEAAQDAWGKLADKVVIFSGTILSHAVSTANGVTSSWRGFVEFADNAIKFGVGAAGAMADAQDKATEAAKKNRDVNLPLATAVFKTAEELAAEAEAAKKAAEALKAHLAQIQALADKYSGAAIARQVNDLADAMKKLGPSANFQLLATDIGKLFQEGAKLSPEMLQLGIAFGTLTPKMVSAHEALRDLAVTVDVLPPKIDKVWAALDQPVPFGITHLKNEFAALVVVSPETMLKGVQVKSIDAGKALGELAQAFAELGQIANGSLGAIVQSFGTIVASINTARKSTDSLKEGIKGFKNSDTLGGLLDMSTGILGIASAAIAAGKALAGLFDRNKGRDLVVDFANSLGGFDALHDQLNELGAEGEKLWIALTQGVGRNNPKEAQAAIDAVTKALDRKNTAFEESTVSTEAEAQATIETAAEAARALDDVNARLKTNADEWGAWSVDVTGYLQTLADTIRAMPIPSPTGPTYTGGSSTYTGSVPRATTGGGRTGGATVVQFVTPNMQVLAEGVIPHIPAAEQRLGVG